MWITYYWEEEKEKFIAIWVNSKMQLWLWNCVTLEFAAPECLFCYLQPIVQVLLITGGKEEVEVYEVKCK